MTMPVPVPVAVAVAGLGVSCRADRGYFIVTLCGPLNAAVAPRLREYLLRLTIESAGRLVIDVSAVTDADVHGLTVLIGTRRRAGLLGGLLRVAAPPAEVEQLLSRTGLDRQLRIYPSVEAAVSVTPSA
jgi:anti-sigma B factor antagonist